MCTGNFLGKAEMAMIRITRWWDGMVLHELESTDLRSAVVTLVEQRADLRELTVPSVHERLPSRLDIEGDLLEVAVHGIQSDRQPLARVADRSPGGGIGRRGGGGEE